MKIKEKLKAHASKIAAAVTGGAVMIAGAVPALAAMAQTLPKTLKQHFQLHSRQLSLMPLAL